MTPEELNRKIEFIVESQARLAAAQEQDRHDRIEFQEWSKDLTGQISRLINHQSRRMDRLDKIYADWSKENRAFQEQVLDFHQQVLGFQKQSITFQRESLEFQRESREFQRESLELQREARRLLNLVLDTLRTGHRP